ncbi:hypothetical protein U14_03803 [Candidatus Moduliflexus flocculans]|uniref:Uncharacterized protein n=1 Tax=Candidatus Moduliflexus flocculans TaxID=1499966 RepID=A0A081BQ85_9BACT|nr:hypothetical protein U14_03803 [Candidatus Moduliflexus flocculans]
MRTANLLFQLMLVEGNFNRSKQFFLFDRLKHIPERIGDFGALQNIIAAMRRKIDHRNVEFCLKANSRFDSIHAAGQLNIHQHQIRTDVRRFLKRVTAGCCYCADNIAQISQQHFNESGNDQIVIHNHDFCRGHAQEFPSRQRSCPICVLTECFFNPHEKGINLL